MKLSALNFTVPNKQIPKYPKAKREDARLMVVDRVTEKIEHRSFSDIVEYFSPGDVLVLNDTRTFFGHLEGIKKKSKARVSLILLHLLDSVEHLWDVKIEPARKIRIGNKLDLSNGLEAEVADNTVSGGRIVQFRFDGTSEVLKSILEETGFPPLPEDLKRKPENIDKQRYITLYGTKGGSTGAPSAGFHFTQYLLTLLEVKDVKLCNLTLHIGYSTYQKIEAEELSKYTISTEPYEISEETAKVVNEARKGGKRVCAVGTSTFKAMESSISYDKELIAGKGSTNNFLHPPYTPKVPTALLTGFHLPRSIDFVNSLAFLGAELGMEVYEMAIEEGYDFFVYGDALLVL